MENQEASKIIKMDDDYTFHPLNVKVIYDHSAEFTSFNAYDDVLHEMNKKEPTVSMKDTSSLMNTVLDASFKYANQAVLSMIDQCKREFNNMLVGEHNENGYVYYAKNKLMYDSFVLFDEKKNVMDFNDVFDENTLKNTKNVVSVIYKKDKEGNVYIADHYHVEDDTFGFPSKFHSVPGGRRDSINPLTTFFSEAYEELRLGACGIDFFDKSTLKGYQMNSRGVLFVFCEVSPDAMVNQQTDDVKSYGFQPFSLTVYKNHEEFLDKKKTLNDQELKAYKKANSFKVLIPRQIGLFDSVNASFEKVSFNAKTLFGIDGRLDCYKKGSIVYDGLQLILTL